MTRQALPSAPSLVYVLLKHRPIIGCDPRAHYDMAQRGRHRQIYETAFDCRVEKKSEENGDLIDRIANHPILQLLRRRSRSVHSSNNQRNNLNNKNNEPSTSGTRSNNFYLHRRKPIVPISGSGTNFNAGNATPKRTRKCFPVKPPRSISTHQLPHHRRRPIGLSKSDDEILNRVDSPEEEDYIEGYAEGQQTKDLAAELQTFHITDDDYFKNTDSHATNSGNVEPKLPRISKEKSLSKSQALPYRLPLRPLELHTPPGTAPLPHKFTKKTPLTDRSPSSWFSPPKEKDIKFPIKKSHSKERALSSALPTESHCSLNASMEVLLDTTSQRSAKRHFYPPSASIKYPSNDSVVTGSTMSSLESLRSSMSDGSKSTVSTESAMSSYRSSMGSDSSLMSRPILNLSAPHRSLIQSAKLQILSPISDKSQEPSLETGGMSQKNSPQDLLELPSVTSRHLPKMTRRNLPDFKNVHHILPGPPQEGNLPGSDSGISIEYGQNSLKKTDLPFNDLPFDMPKLRRRLAQANKTSKTSLSSSNSSISSGPTSDHNQKLCVPPIIPSNPAISRLQNSSGAASGTSSTNSSDWEIRSSAESSDDQGTPNFRERRSLNLDLGRSSLGMKGEKVDINIPLGRQCWYHGALTRGESEVLLRSQSEGSYLVRSLDTSKHWYSLGLKSARGFMHMKIQFDFKTGGYTLGRGSKLYPSIPHIVSHYSVFRLPIKGAEHLLLLHPVPSETL